MTVEYTLILLMFLSFLGALSAGYPIAYVLGGIGILFAGLGHLSDLYAGTSTGLGLSTLGLLVNRVYKIMDNWVLIALPLFIFMGFVLERTRLAEDLMHNLNKLLKNLKGGLALSVLLIGVLLAASTGIIGASVVLLGTLSLPMLLKAGYKKELALGTIAGAGTLGILIPPSIMLVIMADQASLPVGDLFMGALIPGLLLATLYGIYILLYCYFKAPSLPSTSSKSEHSKIFIALLKSVFPPLCLILIVLGSIFLGWATPTEASALGALGAVFLATLQKKFNLKIFQEVCEETLSCTGFIFAIFLGATSFSLVLRELGGDEAIQHLVSLMPGGSYSVLACMLLLIFLLGFFLDWIEITLIILPLLAPLIQGLSFSVPSFGIVENPELIWFLILVSITLQSSFLTPPVGFALFYLKGICPPEIQLKNIYRGVIPFVCLQLIALAILILFPALVTWLPSIAYKP